MPRITITFGIALIALGVGFFWGTGRDSYTALIPAIPGVLLILCGYLAMIPQYRSLFMHIAMVIALLSTLAGAGRAIPLLLADEPVSGAVLAATGLMALISLGLLVIGIGSFIQARRQPQQDAATQDTTPETTSPPDDNDTVA